MSNRTSLALLPLVLLVSHTAAVAAGVGRSPHLFRLRPSGATAARATNEREQDGLAGPVRRVKTETAKITVKGGKPVEGARQVLETTTYDQKGNRVDNAYFLAAGGSLTGKEVYKYDERGNIVEMTLHNDDGTLLAKEIYAYDFDAVGNWTKMTTSVAMMEGGKVTFEPSEVTYRSISYYLDESVLAKMSTPAPAAQAAAQPAATPATQAPTQTAAARPQPSTLSANTAANTAANTQPQAKPTPAASEAAKSAPARNTAAPLSVATMPAANVSAPVSSSNASPAAAGPAVSSEGEAPVVPLRSGPLKPISGGILNGKAISLPPPSYPEAARRARMGGIVEVEVVIDLNGKVISAKAVRGPGLLQASAEMAAKMARFTPTLLSGQPMKVVGVITYNFTMQ